MSVRTSGRGQQPAGVAALDGAPAVSPGPAHRHLGLALVVIAAAQLMVVLDATIVNVALPHIQDALGFSGSGLEWVVNAYALTFGGFLLLGGRAGDILGRRRVFIAGIVLFALASLAGGFATSQAWLLTARAIQGVGGAIVAPTALSLITTTFPEGPRRNRAMGVYAAMSIGGAAIGLLLGGVLTTYVSWRWVFFVNVPIAIIVALMAPRVLSESKRPVRPARCHHRDRRPGRPGLRPVQRGNHRQRRLALGGHQGARVAHRGSRAAGVVPGDRVAQQARPDAAADLQ
jgi:MFS family permease